MDSKKKGEKPDPSVQPSEKAMEKIHELAAKYELKYGDKLKDQRPKDE